MLSRDRVQATRIAVTLVAGERKSAPSYREPAQRVSVHVNDESHGPSITSSCSCRVAIFELRLEAPVEQARDAAGWRALIAV
jgi:hypothetical protein